MSIICSIKSTDCLIIGSDNRCTITKDGHIEYQDDFKKLFFLESVSVGIASCGEAILDNLPLADYFVRFEKTQINAEKDSIATVAVKLFADLVRIGAKDSYHLVCGFFNNSQIVFSVSLSGIEQVRDTIICKGHEAYCSALEVMYSKQDLHPYEEAMVIAKTIILITIKGSQVEAKDEAGYNSCGGNATLLIIYNNKHKWIELPLA